MAQASRGWPWRRLLGSKHSWIILHYYRLGGGDGGPPQSLGVRAGVCARLRLVLSHYARDLSLDVSWGHALHLAAAARASLEASLPIATHTLLWLEEGF